MTVSPSEKWFRKVRRQQVVHTAFRNFPLVLGLVLVGASAFGSFVFGYDLAREAGASSWVALLWPFVIAVTVFQAALSLAFLGGPERTDPMRRARRYYTAVLVAGVVISAAGNTYHAIHVGPMPTAVVVLVLSVPMLCLLVCIYSYVFFVATRRY